MRLASDAGRFPYSPQYAEDKASRSPIAKLLLGISSQVALFTAALYYFGWARAEATFQYFGLDASFTGFSTTDFILRSVPMLFAPLVPILLLTLLATFIHSLVITPILTTTARARAVAGWIVLALRPACFVVLASAASSLTLQWAGIVELGTTLPIALAATTAGYAYCEHLDVAHKLAPQRRRVSAGQSGTVHRAALLGLFMAAVFWAVGLYATQAGRNVATEVDGGERAGSTVVLYATG